MAMAATSASSMVALNVALPSGVSTKTTSSSVCARAATEQGSLAAGLGHGAIAGLGNCPRLMNSTFSGIQLQVRTQASVRKQNFGVPIRAAGAKGDYLVKKVSARELDDILANERSSPMVVDFYATWCGPCILLAQELEQLAVEYGDRVRFLKIDTDEEHELANQMEIRGLPTMVFVSPDTEKLAIRTEGLLSTNVIRDIIEKEL